MWIVSPLNSEFVGFLLMKAMKVQSLHIELLSQTTKISQGAAGKRTYVKVYCENTDTFGSKIVQSSINFKIKFFESNNEP